MQVIDPVNFIAILRKRHFSAILIQAPFVIKIGSIEKLFHEITGRMVPFGWIQAVEENPDSCAVKDGFELRDAIAMTQLFFQ